MDDENILRNCRPPMGCLFIDGKRYLTYKGINTVGRCTSATVTLKSLDISKQHAIITIVDENQHYLSDIQSFNGTFLEGSKLSPLILYKLVENSKIDFGSVTATYNTVTSATYENYYLNSLHNTQTATQSLYDANTQAVQKEISIRNSSPNLQQENFFDDDYSFDDISTQTINESVNSTRPVFKIPFSIHEAPTQEVCTDNTSLIVDDVTDIHNMKTQKLDLNPVIKINEHLNINEIPTQILTLENEKENFDTTSIIDETVLNNSNFEVPKVIISETEDSDSQSALHVSQLYRRSIKPISDSEESDPSLSEVICSSQSSDEVLKCKQKRRFVIESDSETDVENLDENIKNHLGFDTDQGVETNIEKFGSMNHLVPKTIHINSIPGIDSDSDADDFEFNAQISDQCKSDSIRSSKNYENSIDSDDDILGTSLNEKDSNENKIKNSSKVINSVDDMDSLYLEVTQIIGHDSHMDKKNVSSSSDCESVCRRSHEQVQERSTNLVEPEVNSILEKIVKHKSNVNKNDVNELDDDITPQIIRVDSSPLDAHNLYFEKTQPIDIDQQKLNEVVKGNDEEFLKNSQPVIMTSDENCKQMKGVNEAESTFESYRCQQKEFETTKKNDDIFLEPTQPLTIANDQRNKGVKRIQSTLRSNQEQHNTEETDDIFLEPTQPLHFDNDKTSKRVKVAILQPIQSNLSPHREQLDNTGETDNIFLEPTQPLNVVNDQRSTRVKSAEDVFLKPTQSILNLQQQQSENIREADDVSLDVTPITVIARDKTHIEDSEDIFLEPTQPIVEGTNIEEVITTDEVISETTRLLVINNDVTNKQIEGSDMKPAIPNNVKINDQKKKDQIVLEYSSPINVAINRNDHDNTSVENKLEEIFATQKLSTNNEIQSQFEVLFESQNVYYCSDVSERPKNPLLNEFESGNRKKYLNTDGLGTGPISLIPEEVKNNLPNSDLNITNCIEGGSKNVDKPKRLSLSLKSNLRLGTDREIECYDKLAKIRNNFCKNDEIKTKNNTEEPTNSISNKPNDSKISKLKSMNEKLKKILDKSSNTCTKEVKSSTFNDDTVRLMRSEKKRLGNSKTTNLTNITKSPEMVDIEIDSSKSTKTRAPSTRCLTTIHNNLDDSIHTANLQKMESPKTSNCTRTRTRSKNQSSHQLNNPSINTHKRKLSIARANKELTSESQEANIHTVKKTRRVEFDVIESKSVQLTQPNKKKRTDVSGTSQTKQRKKDVEEVNVDTPVKLRNKRKHKVVFTMLDSPELESVIRSLGGTVVNSVESCTVLVTANLQRTQKLLAAVGQSKPICSPKWLQDSKKARQFLDPWEYILEDKDAESSWNVSLKQSLLKSQTQKLLHNCLVYVTVTNSVDILKAAIESCGGKCVTKAPSKLNNENLIVVANPKNKSKYSKFLKRDPPVQIVLPEAIFDGVLRQELRFQDHLIL